MSWSWLLEALDLASQVPWESAADKTPARLRRLGQSRAPAWCASLALAGGAFYVGQAIAGWVVGAMIALLVLGLVAVLLARGRRDAHYPQG